MTNYIVHKVSEPRLEKQRVDGKPRRELVTLYFKPNGKTDNINQVVRNIFSKINQAGEVTWGVFNNAKEFAAQALGLQRSGNWATRTVAPYDIKDAQGNVTASGVTRYTMFIFEGEDVATMFRRQGHPLAETIAVPAKQAMTADAPAEELNA